MDKVSKGSDWKCFKDLKNHKFYFSGDHGCEIITVKNV